MMKATVWLILFALAGLPGPTQTDMEKARAQAQAKREALAARLLAAKTTEERARLMDAEPGAVTPPLAGLFLVQGMQAFEAADYTGALTRFDICEQVSVRIGLARGKADSHYGRGNVYLRQGAYSQAEAQFRAALAYFTRPEDRIERAAVLNSLGLVYHEQGDDKQAMVYYDRSLAELKEPEDSEYIPQTLNNIGNLAHSRGDYDRALEYFQKCLDLKAARPGATRSAAE